MKVSNPDRIVFPEPGYTKGDLVAYYQRVAPAMLPHLAGRPVTLQRFPDHIGKPGFLQKNASDYFPSSIERIEVPKEGGVVHHPVVDQVDDLLYLANQRTVTFHVWTSRLPQLEQADRLILDLDPEEGDYAAARFAARAVHEVLEAAGLEAGLMTTGSNGYHVVAPIRPDLRFDEVGRVARLVAELASARDPDRLTTEFLKRERKGRVFVDWLRNRWAQTAVSPWSLRARPGAPVATPISWDELDATDPQRWTMATIDERLGMSVEWPPPGDLAAASPRIEEMAARAGVSADEPFDRFGRRR